MTGLRWREKETEGESEKLTESNVCSTPGQVNDGLTLQPTAGEKLPSIHQQRQQTTNHTVGVEKRHALLSLWLKHTLLLIQAKETMWTERKTSDFLLRWTRLHGFMLHFLLRNKQTDISQLIFPVFSPPHSQAVPQQHPRIQQSNISVLTQTRTQHCGCNRRSKTMKDSRDTYKSRRHTTSLPVPHLILFSLSGSLLSQSVFLNLLLFSACDVW